MRWNALRRTLNAYSHVPHKPYVNKGLAIGTSGLLLSCCSCESETENQRLGKEYVVNGDKDGTIQKAFGWMHDKYDDHVVHSSLFRFGRAAYAVSVIRFLPTL